VTRARIIDALRTFLGGEGFLEVQTPLMIPAPAPEPYIDAFAVPQGRGKSDLYLIPSPELCLKRLLSEGIERVFQLGPVFRKGERGRHHLPEFTMLEWYRTGADYHGLMADCEAMMQVAAKAAGSQASFLRYGDHEIDIAPPYVRITVESAFERYAGWRPGPEPDAERFNADMVARVEPNLPHDRPVFLLDFPASCASLARLNASDPAVAERVEWYVAGLELGNGFSELTDPEEQEARFRREAGRRRVLGLAEYPFPEDFIASLRNLPPCAGMALGIDRLVMFLTDAQEIDDVVPFPGGASRPV
jgi:lysyl-tRNA synthetase class 2